MRLTCCLVALALLSAPACAKKKDSPPPPAPAPATPSAAAPADQKGEIHKHANLTPDEPMSMMGRLTFEASHRPTGVLKTEDVLAALKSAGSEVQAPQQVLAVSVRAAYCIAGATKGGTGVTICEFADEASATAGRQYSIEKLAGVKNRLLSAHRGTLLTVTTTVDPPESDVEGKKIVELFEKL